jgi:mannose-6-phosphate isomerase-like protein (cupin superfamily)
MKNRLSAVINEWKEQIQKEKELRAWWNHTLTTKQREILLKKIKEDNRYSISGVDGPMLLMDRYKGKEYEIWDDSRSD